MKLKRIDVWLILLTFCFSPAFSQDETKAIELAKQNCRSYHLNSEQSKILVDNILKYAKYKRQSLLSIKISLQSCITEVGMTPEQAFQIVNLTIRSSQKNVWPALADFLPYVLDAFKDFSASETYRLIKNTLKNMTAGGGTILYAGLKSIQETCSERGFTKEETLEFISEIAKIAKNHTWAGFECAEYLLKEKKEKKFILKIINQTVSLTKGTDTNLALRYVIPAASEEFDGKNLKQILNGGLIVVKYTGIYADRFVQLAKVTDIRFSTIKDRISLATSFATAINNYFEIHQKPDKKIVEIAGELINQMHDRDMSDDLIRKTIAIKTTLRSKYYLIALANQEHLYQTTFEALYNNFPPDFIRRIKEEIDVEEIYASDFVIQLCSRNKGTEILDQDPDFLQRGIKKGLEEKTDLQLLNNGAALTSVFVKFYEEPKYSDQRDFFAPFLKEQFKKAKTRYSKGVFGYLIKLNQKRNWPKKDKPELDKIYDSLPAIPLPKVPDFWLSDRVLAAKLYFYTDERYNWLKISLNQLSCYGNLEIKKRNRTTVVLEETINNIRLKIVLTIDKSDIKEAIEGKQFDIIAHRGHSYNLFKTFSGKSKVEKLFYLGSCGSLGQTVKIMLKYPYAHLISDENSSRGDESNLVLYQIMKKIVLGERSWKNLKSRYAAKEGLVFPHEKGQLLMKFIFRIPNSKGSG